MRKSVCVFAAAAGLCLAASSVQALPVTSSSIVGAAQSSNIIEKTAVYIVEGRRYCFYFNGWHGPGWYRCGFARRRGLGWGGVYGWRGWEYGPAARRFSRGGATIREGERGYYRRGFREGGSYREGTTVRGGTEERRATTGESTRMHEPNFKGARGGSSIGGEKK